MVRLITNIGRIRHNDVDTTNVFSLGNMIPLHSVVSVHTHITHAHGNTIVHHFPLLPAT